MYKPSKVKVAVRGEPDGKTLRIMGDMEMCVDASRARPGNALIIACSDGTLINAMRPDEDGWRLRVSKRGSCALSMSEPLEGDPEPVSHTIKMEGVIAWMVITGDPNVEVLTEGGSYVPGK